MSGSSNAKPKPISNLTIMSTNVLARAWAMANPADWSTSHWNAGLRMIR